MKSSFVGEEFAVGQKVGRLTITSLRPFRQVCECGAGCARTRTALHVNGVRSCGCGARARTTRTISVGMNVGIYVVLASVAGRQWLVRCTRCNTEKVTGATNLYGQQKRCKQCD